MSIMVLPKCHPTYRNCRSILVVNAALTHLRIRPETMKIQLFHGDCLEVMKSLPEDSVDMVLSDLPYGVLGCEWDEAIPLAPLWKQYWRVLKPHGSVVLTAVQPFTTNLISSQMEFFKYCWIWRKSRASGFVHASNMPLKDYEDICVFSRGGVKHATPAGNRMAYFPQGLEPLFQPQLVPMKTRGESVFNAHKSHRPYLRTVGNYPRQVLDFPSVINAIHPTQKPVPLFEYLIQTYTKKGQVVLDSCLGSGTTGVACVNTDRSFIGIEKSRAFFELARDRIFTMPKMLEQAENPHARGARKTHFIRVSKHETAIQQAIKDLRRKKSKITKTAVAEIVGLSRQQITQRYAHLFVKADNQRQRVKPVSSNSRRNKAARQLAKVAAE